LLQNLKRFYSILLLLCLIAPVVFIYARLQSEKNAIRKQVKRQMIAGMDREKLVCLTFSFDDAVKQIKWEHSREFEFEGQMYDVVETVTHQGMVSYWCWPDNEETEVNRSLNNLVCGRMSNDPRRTQSQKNLENFFKNLWSEVPLIFVSDKSSFSDILYENRTRPVCAALFQPPVPPPEV
jgi:hypothetical protein